MRFRAKIVDINCIQHFTSEWLGLFLVFFSHKNDCIVICIHALVHGGYPMSWRFLLINELKYFNSILWFRASKLYNLDFSNIMFYFFQDIQASFHIRSYAVVIL